MYCMMIFVVHTLLLIHLNPVWLVVRKPIHSQSHKYVRQHMPECQIDGCHKPVRKFASAHILCAYVCVSVFVPTPFLRKTSRCVMLCFQNTDYCMHTYVLCIGCLGSLWTPECNYAEFAQRLPRRPIYWL